MPWLVGVGPMVVAFVFFQAEDGIRDYKVTGVQTCALPISHVAMEAEISDLREDIAPTWLQEPLSIEETAERFVRPALQGKIGRASCRERVENWVGGGA